MAYTLTQREYSRLKGRLTRACKSGDPGKVISEVRYARAIFDAKGWPDDWYRWQSANDDAAFAASRARL